MGGLGGWLAGCRSLAAQADELPGGALSAKCEELLHAQAPMVVDLAVRFLIPIAAQPLAAFLLPAAEPPGSGAQQARSGGGIAAGSCWRRLGQCCAALGAARWYQCCYAGSGSGNITAAAAAVTLAARCWAIGVAAVGGLAAPVAPQKTLNAPVGCAAHMPPGAAVAGGRALAVLVRERACLPARLRHRTGQPASIQYQLPTSGYMHAPSQPPNHPPSRMPACLQHSAAQTAPAPPAHTQLLVFWPAHGAWQMQALELQCTYT